MKKSVIVLGFMMILALTGCSEDAVVQQAKKEKIDFQSSIYEIKIDQKEAYPEVNVSEKQVAAVKKVVDIMNSYNQKWNMDEKYREMVDDEDESMPYYEDKEVGGLSEDEIWGNPQRVEQIFKENAISLNQVGSYTVLDRSEYTYTREQMMEILGALEQEGFTSLKAPFEDLVKEHEKNEDQGQQDISRLNQISPVRCGIEFCLSCDEYLVRSDTDAVYTILVQIPLAMVLPPANYHPWLDQNITDGWYIGCVNVGGYMDRINLISSFDDPENPYNKMTDIYIKDGEPVEVECQIKKNFFWEKDSADDLIFSENERETMSRLIGWICEDEREAEKFVSGISGLDGKSGEVGSCEWKIKKKRDMYILTIQKKS